MSVRLARDELAQMLASAIDAAGVGMLLHDDDTILFASSAVADALGATPGADLAGLRLDSFIVPELEGVTKERRGYLMRDRVSFSDLPIKVKRLDGGTTRLRVDARTFEFRGRTIGTVTIRSIESCD